jgi:transmembrane sensor
MNHPPRKPAPAEIDATASDWIIRRDSGLSAAEQDDFARWQAADARHTEAVARHEIAWSMLDRPLLSGRVAEMVRRLSARVSQRRRRIGAASAAVVILAGLGIFLALPRPIALITPAVNAVVYAPQKQILPDGSVVEFSTGTELAIDYGGELRRINVLRGTALFHVTPDPQRAFVVTAYGIEIRAVGTAFLVQLSEAQVEVVVTEGKVAVDSAIAPKSAPAGSRLEASEYSALVEAGTRVTIDANMGPVALQPLAISPAEIASRLAWRSPRLEFYEVPMGDAVALLNQHSTIRLVVDDPVLARMSVNGIFRADNTEALVRLLESSLNVQAARDGDTIVLSRRPVPPAGR